MKYLDQEQLSAIDCKSFRAATPYPWCNPTGILTEAGFAELTGNMPEVEQFRGFFGKQRKHGQRSHDRYVLDYEQGMSAPQPWLDFIEELKSSEYRRFAAELLGKRAVRFRFHWHYTPTACEVSPHCDSAAKLGNHIFYMNTHEDWQDSWGGATIVLDDHGTLPAHGNPDFDKFAEEIPTRIMENRSFIMDGRGDSWHGVRPLTNPDNTLRKVFIVVYYGTDTLKTSWKRLRRAISGQDLVTEKESQIY
jgi:hypothetical protein